MFAPGVNFGTLAYTLIGTNDAPGATLKGLHRMDRTHLMPSPASNRKVARVFERRTASIFQSNKIVKRHSNEIQMFP